MLSRLALFALLLVPGALMAQAEATLADVTPSGPKAKVVVSKAWYPDHKCLVQDKDLKPEKTVVHQVEGRTVKLCCKRCVKAVDQDPKKFLAKLDAKIAHSQMASYPLQNCPVSGEKLGSMGKPHDIVVEGRLVRLCCAGCEETAKKKGGEIVAKIATAMAEKHGDEAGKCPVSGKDVEAGKGVNLVYGAHVMRLCCNGCVKKFEKEPSKYLAPAHAGDHGAKHGDHGAKHDDHGAKHDGHGK